MTARFRRRGGVVTARFTSDEAAVLRQVAGEVLELLADPGEATTDPVLARLFPDGYRDDSEAAAELRRLTESSLRAGKVANAEALLAGLPEGGGLVRLADDDAVDAWLRAINDVRLTLGTRLGVTEERVIADSEPYALVVYDWLGWLQETLVKSASAGR